MHKIVAFCLLCLALTSCTDNAVFDKFHPIAEEGWHKDSTVVFDVLISDTTTSYGIILRLRHNAEYPYQNLYLFREITSATGREFSDTVSYTLAKPTGEWLGEGFGALKTIETPFSRNLVRFSKTGIYQFHIAQGMRDEQLQGIEEVGLRIEPMNIETDDTK